jgi:hypothetical protein
MIIVHAQSMIAPTLISVYTTIRRLIRNLAGDEVIDLAEDDWVFMAEGAIQKDTLADLETAYGATAMAINRYTLPCCLYALSTNAFKTGFRCIRLFCLA